ncbi:uncharacterized protein N7511_008647 [Penicillium nucicola]|uniref:uncharacterized protein n=1 Tax=Penicillium nucicola TaxID=1850975 RepID=UPI002544E7A5|nr:uncharacterized protein N7511_008647 [Penicillium nucicola]KAJ5746951.1 hypothetical protein N7511_008647 [Penicillium nucicola]
MAGEPQPAQKRPRLPFKPPSRTAASAGPSSVPKTKGKAKQTSTKASTSTSASKPSASASKASKGKSTAADKRPRSESPQSEAASQSGSESEPESSESRSRSVSQEPDYILAEITHSNPAEDVTSSEPTIPAKLLTRLLHQHFQNEKTKVAKDANGLVAKYVDVFVREAIARAAYERAETDGNSSGRRVGDGFLEVEDLEKMAPQLTMDF